MSFDMEHFSTELDSLKRREPMRRVGEVEEEELVQLIVGILFAILWRGCVLVPSAAARRPKSGESQGQLMPTYGQIIAAINLLGKRRGGGVDFEVKYADEDFHHFAY